MMLRRGSELKHPFSHVITSVNNSYFTLYCVASIFLDFVYVHPILHSNCPSLSPASGEKKAITHEMKLKMVAQHEGGKPVMAIAFELGLSQLIISTILKD